MRALYKVQYVVKHVIQFNQMYAMPCIVLHFEASTPSPPTFPSPGLNGSVVYSPGLAGVACYRIPAVIQVR